MRLWRLWLALLLIGTPLYCQRSPGIFRQTASVTIVNSAAETTLIGSGVGSVTLPANFITPGMTFKVRGFGLHTAAANPSVEVKIKFGTTILLDTGIVTSGNSTNALLDIEAWITCRSSGAGGTVFAQGWYREHTGGASGGTSTSFNMVNTSATTVDTTAAQTINITWQWGTASASDSATLTNLIIELVQQ